MIRHQKSKIRKSDDFLLTQDDVVLDRKASEDHTFEIHQNPYLTLGPCLECQPNN